MKNIQPDLSRKKQIHKAIADISFYLGAMALDKAAYALGLLNKMLDSFDRGQPEPWSNYQPMIEEEFS
jgi:hypothetical protein